MNSNHILQHRSRRQRLSSQGTPPPQQQSVKRFVRLHAPFELLLELAEKTRMKLPIEVRMYMYIYRSTDLHNECYSVFAVNMIVFREILIFFASFFPIVRQRILQKKEEETISQIEHVGLQGEREKIR